MNFSLQVGQGRSHVNTSSTIYKGIDLLFADIFRCPTSPPMFLIGTSSMILTLSVFLHLQKLTSMIMMSLCLPIMWVQVFLGLFSIGHTYDFYVAEDWFGMTDLDLQSHVIPSGVVNNSSCPSSILFCFSFHLFRVLWNRFDFQTSKFNIKVLVRVNSVLKVWPEANQEYNYHLQRDGWWNVFTDEKSQTMRSDGIPWRGAREKHHAFFYHFCYFHR